MEPAPSGGLQKCVWHERYFDFPRLGGMLKGGYKDCIKVL